MYLKLKRIKVISGSFKEIYKLNSENRKHSHEEQLGQLAKSNTMSRYISHSVPISNL